MTVFLDTVGLLALWDESDQWHEAARAQFERLQKARANVLTTTFVLLECGNAAARRPYRSAVDRLRKELERGERLIIVPSAEDWHAAWLAYEIGEKGTTEIVDHVSFVVMRRLDLAEAFTNDKHFKAAGFKTLF